MSMETTNVMSFQEVKDHLEYFYSSNSKGSITNDNPDNRKICKDVADSMWYAIQALELCREHDMKIPGLEY